MENEKKAILYMTDGFETVEALAVADVLVRAGVSVELVSVTGQDEVKSAHGITVKTDRLFGGSPEDEQADILILPGGPGSFTGNKAFKNIKGLKEIFEKQNEKNGGIAAICAAPTALGVWGLLKDKMAICFPGFEKELFGARVQSAPVRVVTDENIITARGMGTAIDFALAITEFLFDAQTAEQIGKDIQYID